MSFQLDIISLTGTLFSGEVEKMLLPGVEGELTVLGKHMPLVTPLTLGEVEVKVGSEVKSYTIGKGLLMVSEDKNTLLIEDASQSEELSEERVKEAKRLAEELIAKGPQEDQERATYLLRRSLLDLKNLQRKKPKLA